MKLFVFFQYVVYYVSTFSTKLFSIIYIPFRLSSVFQIPSIIQQAMILAMGGIKDTDTVSKLRPISQ